MEKYASFCYKEEAKAHRTAHALVPVLMKTSVLVSWLAGVTLVSQKLASLWVEFDK